METANPIFRFSPHPITASAFSHPRRERYDETDPLVRHDYSRRLKATALYDAVRAIAEGEIVAAHHHRVFKEEECAKVYERAAKHHELTPYEGAPDLGHIGMSFFETSFGDAQRTSYFESALGNIDRARALWGDNRFPLDLVRSLLDEASPKGANLLRIDGRVCAAGLIRAQDDGAEIKHHVDHCGWDMTESLEAQQVEAQVSVVILLSKSESGGDTTVYPARLGKHHYDARRLPEPFSYAVDESTLPSLHVTLRPEVGDLMMFDARHLHSVSKVGGGSRLSLSFFIGVCRDGRLVIFS